jgi:hypothetical protein
MAVGLVVTLGGETLAFLGAFKLPSGMTVSGASLLLALATYLIVSQISRRSDPDLDPDVRLVMES